jgi:indoleamine 2,3-dioxygenase
MDKPHRDFLEFLVESPSIRAFCTKNGLDADFHACVEGMREFRNDHIKMVTRYIILPSGKEVRSKAETSVSPEKVRGTGGTDLIPFLKQMRDESY